MMKPDNEQIIRLLSEAQEFNRTMMLDLLKSGARPQTLRCVLDAACSLECAFNDLGMQSGHVNHPPMVATMPVRAPDPNWLDRLRGDEGVGGLEPPRSDDEHR
jgi:hypothetical protein